MLITGAANDTRSLLGAPNGRQAARPKTDPTCSASRSTWRGPLRQMGRWDSLRDVAEAFALSLTQCANARSSDDNARDETSTSWPCQNAAGVRGSGLATAHGRRFAAGASRAFVGSCKARDRSSAVGPGETVTGRTWVGDLRPAQVRRHANSREEGSPGSGRKPPGRSRQASGKPLRVPKEVRSFTA